MADDLILQFGYLGIFLVLVLGGLGLPVPEEAPIIIAAVLAHHGKMWWPLALASCFAGVLVGDFIVYFLGYHYGEKVLKLRLTRKFLTREREAQIQGYFHRHGVKILILGRFAVGFRTAAYLTAGILRLPPLRLFLTDLAAATFSTFLMFGLGYVFADKLQEGLHEAQHYIVSAVALGIGGWILHRYIKARHKAGRVIGPPVLVEDKAQFSLPLDDLSVEAAGPTGPSLTPLNLGATPPLPGDSTEPIQADAAPVEASPLPPVAPDPPPAVLPPPTVEASPTPPVPAPCPADGRPALGRMAAQVGAAPAARSAHYSPAEPG